MITSDMRSDLLSLRPLHITDPLDASPPSSHLTDKGIDRMPAQRASK
jgi:hypothetical protein